MATVLIVSINPHCFDAKVISAQVWLQIVHKTGPTSCLFYFSSCVEYLQYCQSCYYSRKLNEVFTIGQGRKTGMCHVSDGG